MLAFSEHLFINLFLIKFYKAEYRGLGFEAE